MYKSILPLLLLLALNSSVLAKITPITKSADLKEKLQGNAVIKFYSTKCNPCKQIKPNVEELSNQYTNINFLEVNTEGDAGAKIAGEYGVRALPTLVLINKKKETKKIVGYKSKQDLKTEFDTFFKE